LTPVGADAGSRYKKIVAHIRGLEDTLVDLFCRMRANQLRLLFSTIGYLLHHVLREFGLKGTEMATAQAGTIRTKLLKIGARIRVSVRRVWISPSESYPYQALFERVLENLRRQTPQPLRIYR
jgi:hypothetical protein